MAVKRIDRLNLLIAPAPRFFSGMILLSLYLSFDDLVIRLPLTAIAFLLLILSGKKLLWKNYLILILAVTFFNILNPWGEVLLLIGGFPITKGALTTGLTKGLAFTGMIALSLASISRGLVLPGKLGTLLGGVFFYFEKIFEEKHKINRKELIGSLDTILLQIFYGSIRLKKRREILFEDDHLIIVHKEAEEMTVPGRGVEKQRCLSTVMKSLYGDHILTIHRLDQPTTGLVVFAKDKECQRRMGILFQNREVEKEYIALVDGEIKGEEGIISLPIRGDKDNRPYQIVDNERGKSSMTNWEVLDKGDSKSRLLLKPKTGRTHQLRLHLSSIGHPIVGDRLYNENCPPNLWGGLHLHSRSLKFTHPFTGQVVEVSREADF